MALVGPDPARGLAWTEPRYGLVVFSGARPTATLKKSCLSSAPTDRPWPCARHRSGCFTGLRSRCCDPVSMARDRQCSDAIFNRDLETLACTSPHLGRYARQFLGSDRLVMADGKRAWSRAHGRAGTSRRKIGVLRSNDIQHQLTALFSPPDCD